MGRRRKALVVIAIVLTGLGVVVGRAVIEGRDALARGDQALEEGEPLEAIRWWRRAARWYLPMAPHVGRAYDRLEAIAESAGGYGDRDVELAAWRGIRSSVLSTRSFFTPHEERLERANREIAALMAALESPPVDADASALQRRAWHLERLERDPSPRVGWALIAIVGFLLWVGAAFAFALRGLDESDRLVPRAAAYSGVALIVGLGAWLAGLYAA